MRELRVYTLAGSLVGTIDPSTCEWLHVSGEQCSGYAIANGDAVAAAALAPDTYLVVYDGTAERFAWYPLQLPRRQRGRSNDIELTGPGLMHLWSRALLYPETSCRPVDVRWLGPMSDAYTPDGDWISPVSLGRHDSFPFGPGRGDGMADRSAHLVSYTTSRDLTDEKFLARAQFALTEDTDVVIQAYADDFYEGMLDAAPVDELRTPERPYNWRTVQEWRGRLCAGTHTLFFDVGNLALTTNVGDNPVYICWSVMPAAADGAPRASHHAVNVTHNHTSGQWLGIFDGNVTAPIDWDATIGEVETAFNDVVGEGEVTVTGSPGAYVITADGPTVGYTPHVITAQENTLSGGTLSVTTASYGASAEYIAHSDASTGVVLPPYLGDKGLTDYEILELIRDEEIARGNTFLQHITLDPAASATLDSGGIAFPERTIEVPLDNATGWRVIEILMEAGALFDITPGLVQKMWGTGTSRDFDSGQTYVVGDGSDVVEAGNDRSGLTNVLRHMSRTGWSEMTDLASIAIHGRSGATIRLDSYDDDGANRFSPFLLDDLADPQRVVALEVPAEHLIVPYADVDLGQLFNGPGWSTSGFTSTQVRLLEIGGRFEGRSILWTLRGID